MAGVKSLIGLAFAACIGLLFLVLACALYEKWWPLFVCVFYILAPIPLTVSKRITNDTETSAIFEFAIFMTTGIVVSAFAMPVIFAHANIILWAPCALVVAGNAVTFSTIMAYFWVHREDDDSWGASLF